MGELLLHRRNFLKFSGAFGGAAMIYLAAGVNLYPKVHAQGEEWFDAKEILRSNPGNYSAHGMNQEGFPIIHKDYRVADNKDTYNPSNFGWFLYNLNDYQLQRIPIPVEASNAWDMGNTWMYTTINDANNNQFREDNESLTLVLGERTLSQAVSSLQVNNGSVAYIDGGRLFFLKSPSDTPTEITSDISTLHWVGQNTIIFSRSVSDGEDLLIYDVSSQQEISIINGRGPNTNFLSAFINDKKQLYFAAITDQITTLKDDSEQPNNGNDVYPGGMPLTKYAVYKLDLNSPQSQPVEIYSGSESFAGGSHTTRIYTVNGDDTQYLALEKRFDTVLLDQNLEVIKEIPGTSLFSTTDEYDYVGIMFTNKAGINDISPGVYFWLPEQDYIEKITP